MSNVKREMSNGKPSLVTLDKASVKIKKITIGN